MSLLKSNRAIDDAVSSATNFEEMRENLLSTLAKQGVIERDSSTAFGVRILKSAVPDVEQDVPTAKTAASYGHDRIIYIGNTRIILTGVSEADLDTQEEAIRGQR